jgi:hypothetical protein
MRGSIARSLDRRGGRAMTSSVSGSTPMASAGAESVIRLIHKICVASRGSTSVRPVPRRPIASAKTTPRNTVSTSPMFDDKR